MKKIILLSFAIFIIINSCFAQGPLIKQWDKRFGGTSGDGLYSFRQTKDGGYILGGQSGSGIGGDKSQPVIGMDDYWIVKIDSIGNKQWDKTFGSFEIDWFHSVIQTSDGGYLLGGYTKGDIGGDKTEANRDTSLFSSDFWIVKVDSSGNKQWDKTFGGNDNDDLMCMVQSSDGGFLIGGISTSGISGDKTQALWGVQSDYWIVKLDSLGNKTWDRDLGGTNVDALTSLENTADGGFLVGGTSLSGISGDKTQPKKGGSDWWIVRIDSVGNKLWDVDFGGTDNDGLFSVRLTSDGGFIAGGISTSNAGGDKTQPTQDTVVNINYRGDFWIIKADSLGNKIWDKDFGGAYIEDDFFSVLETSDGGFLVSGTSYSDVSGDKTENNLGDEQIWAIKTDSNGIKLWDKTIFTGSHDETGPSIQTLDGCFAFANYTSSPIAGYVTQPNNGPTLQTTDYWIVKFCDSTVTTHLQQYTIANNEVDIFPNPFTNALSLNFKNDIVNNHSTISIRDISGRIIQSVLSVPANLEINTSSMSRGFYFLEISGDEKKITRKIIKE